MQDVVSLAIGDAKVTLISSAFMKFAPSLFIDVKPEHRTPDLAQVLDAPVVCPVFCVHVALPGMSLLVDASYEIVAPGSSSYPEGIQQPPGLVARLRERGIAPEHITHVVLTHGHGDHISGLALDQNGARVPQYPNAGHYFGKAEWHSEAFQAELAKPNETTAQNLGVVQQHGLLQLVEGDLDLGNGISILAAPGETPGHQVVRIESRGQVAYALGDLFHFPFEFAHPHIFAKWKNVPQITASRAKFMQRFRAENAVLLTSHIPSPGRLIVNTAGTAWQALHV